MIEKTNATSLTTIWDELASFDMLMEYINEFLNDKVEANSELKARLFDSIYRHYQVVCPEAEIYYAEKFINSIHFFLDGIKECRNQKQ